MASVNKCILVGNIGAAPETRYTPGGDAVCTVRLATSESWKDKATGEKKEHTEWHRVVFYRKLAEIVGQYVKKGSQLYVEGQLQTRKWTDKDGVDRYTTEIVASEMQLLGRSQSSGSNDDGGGDDRPAPEPSRAQRGTSGQAQSGGGGAYGDDDIPFAPTLGGRAWFSM